jgi:hypothetical protein
MALAFAVGLGATGARANEKDEDEQKVEMKDLTADVQKSRSPKTASSSGEHGRQ